MAELLWPRWLDDILAKSPQSDEGDSGESLPHHTWYVLEKLAELMRLRPRLPETLGFRGLWACLFWACFLHDFGKAASGFQSMLRGNCRWTHRHEVLSLAFVDWLSEVLPEADKMWVVAAILSHHREANELELTYLDPIVPEEDPLIPRLAEIGNNSLVGLWRWLKECLPSWVEVLA